MLTEHMYEKQGIKLKYYEARNDLQPLVLLHAHGVDSLSFARVAGPLSRHFDVYAVDCCGHGGACTTRQNTMSGTSARRSSAWSTT